MPAVVVRAARIAARDHQGVVGYRIHRANSLHAGLYHRTDDVELAVVFENDRLVKVRVLRDATDGKPASDAAKAQLAATLEQGAPGQGFAVPFDARNFADYRFAVADASTVRFVSIERDARHGDGTFSVDPSGAVVTLSYTPDVLPKYATSALIVDQRAQVLPNFWATAHETQRYDGRYGPFRGSAVVSTDEGGFQRFPNTAAALAALDAGRI
ncbi:MAG TPA: hypothetical protein VIG32_01050 [Candidatus Baltobacteraceae bacterium]